MTTLQEKITDEMSKLAYAIISYGAKLNPDSDVKQFKRLHSMTKAYKDLERLLAKAAEVER